MRKSPLSRFEGSPGGSDSSFSQFGRRNSRGTQRHIQYNFSENANYENSPNFPENDGNDFISFGSSSPSFYNKGHNRNWRNPRGRFYGENSGHNSPYRGNNKWGKNPQKQQTDISLYYDPVSIFENPWEKLEQQHDTKSLDTSGIGSSLDTVPNVAKLSQDSRSENLNTTDSSDNSQTAALSTSIDSKMDKFAPYQDSLEEKSNLCSLESSKISTDVEADLT